MRELFFKLFEMSHFDTGIKVTAFSVSHIVYLLLIVSGIVGTYFLMRGRSYEEKRRLLGAMVAVLLISYISDFFMHEFVYAEVAEDGSLIAGGINMDKLPFHICTVLCPIACLVQFNKRMSRFLEPVVMLSVLAPMMYLAYPASIGKGEPWCYQAVQTMFYHGTLMGWGILNLALGVVKPNVKKCWQSAILLGCITLWAKLGNTLYEGHNWFFLNEDAFYIGLVENGIIPKWSLMIINPAVFFSAIMALYGVVYAIRRLKSGKTPEVGKEEPELASVG